MTMTPLWAWGLTVASVLRVVACELRAHRIGRRAPQKRARCAHARLRLARAQALSAQPGFEIVAVQALRNSLMPATISASTAVVAGIVHPLAMLPVTRLLLVALHHVDRPAELEVE